MAGCIRMPLDMAVGLGPGHIAINGDPFPPKKKKQRKGPQPRPQFSAHICCNQTPTCIKVQLGTDVGLGPGDIVVDGDPAPLPKKGAKPPPQLLAHILKPNGWMDQDGTWRGGGPWFRPHCVKWEPSSPPPKSGHSPQFSAHLYCGQTAGCIKMPLGMQVGLSAGDFVLDGDPASSS